MKQMYKNFWLKGFISLFIFIQMTLLCSCGTLKVSSSQNFSYNFENGEAIITEYHGEELDIVVPFEIEGRPVIRIESKAFKGYDLSSIVFQDGLKEIGDNVFDGCANLKKVTLPQSLQVIGKYAFEDCVSLQDINLPEGLYTLGDCAFYGCGSLETIEVPKGISEINQGCFSECKSLKNVEIYNSSVDSESKVLKVIGKNAFSGCTSLTNIDLPSTITSIKENAFKDCSSLDSIGNDIDLNNIGVEKDAFLNTKFENSFEFSILDGTLISYNGSKKDVVVPDNVVEIGEQAFAKNKEITSVKMSDNVTFISAYAFMDCENLKKVTLSNNISYIGRGAFLRSGLEEINLPKNITRIEPVTFAYTDIKSIDLTDNVKEIGMGAFMDCANLGKVNLPEGLEIIGEVAFANCQKLSSITVPDSIVLIGELSLGTINATIGDKGAVTTSCNGILLCLAYDSNFMIYGADDTIASEYALNHNLMFVDVDKMNSGNKSYIYYRNEYDWSKVYAYFYIGEEPSGQEVIDKSEQMEFLGDNLYRISLPVFKATDVVFSNGRDQFEAPLEDIPGEEYIYDSGSFKWSKYSD